MARDIGRSIYDIQKPDGTPIQQVPYPTHLATGSANRITSVLSNIPARAVDKIEDGKSKAYSDPKKPATVKKNLENLVPNPLEQFASVTPLFTMACINTQQFNNPELYRDNPGSLQNIVFSSAGRYDSQRTKTASGIPEYYVDNFRVKSIIAPNQKSGNQNVFNFEFEVFEPYSMGVFLQSLQNAAINSGYANYLQNAPYVLILDFKGYKENGTVITSVKPKYFVLKLTNVSFTVEESGSRYKVFAVPYNHQGFGDIMNTAYTDVKLVSGEKGNVEEILKSGENSLVNFLNKNEQRLKDAQMIGEKDVYDIQFPEKFSDFSRSRVKSEDKGATLDPNSRITNPTVDFKNVPSLLTNSGGSAQNNRITYNTVDTRYTPSILQSKKSNQVDTINAIGASNLGFSVSRGGNFVFKKYDEVVDEKTGKIRRDQVVIDPKKRTLQFAQAQTITSIIEQVILTSDYAKRALDSKNLTEEGYITWFRIDVQIELLGLDPLIGDYAKKITYRVIPYNVHHTVFSNPNSMPVGYSAIHKQVAKEYNYTYTGQNTDVLDFNIEIDKLFYQGINSSPETDSGASIDQNQKGPAEDTPLGTKTGKGPAEGSQLANLGRARVKKNPNLLKKTVGGTPDKSTEQLVAEAFNSALKTGASADLIQVDLEILGDTYWLIDSGMGNYFSTATSNTSLITDDGSANYENGMIYVYITFRTPTDLNDKTGLYNFPKETAFSGLYRVVECESKFDSGKFTQALKCLRMPSQAIDFEDKSSELAGELEGDRNTVFATEFTEEQQQRVTVTDPVIGSIHTGTAGVSPRITETAPIGPGL